MAQGGGAGNMLQKNLIAQNKSEGSVGLPHGGRAFWRCANLGPLWVVSAGHWGLLVLSRYYPCVRTWVGA